MPDEPTLVEMAAPENAPATTVLPNGQHYTRLLDEATGVLHHLVTVWTHDVDAMKARGFRDPAEKKAADEAHATVAAVAPTEASATPTKSQSRAKDAQSA